MLQLFLLQEIKLARINPSGARLKARPYAWKAFMEVALNSFEADSSSDLVTSGKGLASVSGIKCQFWFPLCCHLVS